MLEIISNPIFIIITAILFALTMKVADLLDEHGLKLFKGSAIFFGVLWGGFGSLLIPGNEIIGNIVIAMVIAFIVRNRLDFFNHQLAATIIIISFLCIGNFSPIIFSIFFVIFAIFGTLRDIVDDKLKKTNTLFGKINDTMLYYPIPAFIYSVYTNDWLIFFTFLLFTISYDLTKYIAKKKGYH